MFHWKVALNFFQQDLEPLHSAWCKYKDLLLNFRQLSFYILFERKPREKSLYPNHHSKQCFVDSKCQRFPYQVNLEDYHDQDPYVMMHVIYYGRKPLFDKHFFLSLLSISNLFSFYFFPFLSYFFCFCVLFCLFLVT